MRGRLFFITLILAGLQVLYGQANYSLGLKAGVAVSNQSYILTPIDYDLDTEPVWGPAFSLFVEAFRGSHFSFQTDLSYLVKGSSSNVESVTVDHMNNDRITVNEGEKSTSRFKYLSISPMARYRMGQGSLHPYFLLGPRLDMLLDYSTDSEYPLDDQNGSIVGLTIGAGLEFSINNLGVSSELQYQGDFMPVTGQDPLLVNNHFLSLTFGIRWLASD